MSESKGGDKNPITARYSVFDGRKLDTYNGYYCGGVNGSRDSHIHSSERKLDINAQIPVKTNLLQSDDVKNFKIPSLCGAGGVLIAADSIRHSFVLYDYAHGAKSYETSLLEGGFVRDASDPVWDGLFFNVILKNKIYRYGLSRKGDLREHSFQYTNYDINEKIENPLVVFIDDRRLLAFFTTQRIFICDISIYKGEKKPIEIETKGLQFLPLLQFKDKIIAVSKLGYIYKIELDNQNNFSPIYNPKEENIENISYPIILNNNLYYLFTLQNNPNKSFLMCFNLEKNEPKSIAVEIYGYCYSDRFLLNDGYRIILKYNFDNQKYLKINEYGIANKIDAKSQNNKFTINIDNFFIYDNKIYSYEETQNTVYVADIKTLQFIESINLQHTINNENDEIVPLSNIIFFDGIIALITESGIYLKKVV